MKSSITTIFIALFLSLSAQAAQRADHQGPDLDSLVTELQLDSTQASQLEELMGKHHQQMQAMRKDKQQSREEMHGIREQHREELLIVLSHEQLYQFEQYMREHRPRHQNNMPTQ